jgi:ferritin-like metal-binding protein YciE
MFERLHTPEEAYDYKLGATLKMEQKLLDMLEQNADEAHDERVKALFRHHHDQTRQHVANVERVFGMMGWEVDDSPCPAIEGLEKEGKSTVRKSADEIIDAILLQTAVEVEHHEIGVYENLILNARAMGREDVAELLGQNIAQEQTTLDEVKTLMAQLAAPGTSQPLT